MTTIQVLNRVLDSFELKNHEYLVSKEYYDNLSGYNEYRLYSYLTNFFNGTVILDIGTYMGRSAVSLVDNSANHVITYNIVDDIQLPGHPIYRLPNLEFRMKNVLDDLTPEFIQNVSMIFIDIDGYGVREREIIAKLDEVGFSGLLFIDDIYHPDVELNRCMGELWEELKTTHNVVDMTRYGHYTGTGLVYMNTDIRLELL